jgi:hypothetical protein
MRQAYTFKIRTANLLFGILVGSRLSHDEGGDAFAGLRTTYPFEPRSLGGRPPDDGWDDVSF